MDQQLPSSAEQAARILNITQLLMLSGLISAAVFLLGPEAIKGILQPTFKIDPIVLALAITGLAMSFIMPPILRSVPPDQQVSDGELFAKFQTSIVVKYAVLEGPAFAAVFLNKDKDIFGILVVVLMVIALGVSYVTPGQIKDYVQQIRELQEFKD